MSRFAGALFLATVLCYGYIECESVLPTDYASFISYLVEFSKPYLNDNSELIKRFPIWQGNIEMINKLNNRNFTSVINEDDNEDDDDDDDSSEEDEPKYASNEFTDMSWDEFTANFANMNGTEHQMVEKMDEWKIPKKNAPVRFDWRRKKRVSPIKNQGSCGSCWAFSVCANAENLYMIKNKGKQVLCSEQQLLDCDRTSHGCNGGWPNTAIKDTIDRGGLMDSQSYPYQGQQGSCRFNKNKVQIKLSKNNKLQGNNEEGMAKYLSSTSSLILLVNVVNSFQHYKSGIYNPSAGDCDPSTYNHALVTVAYGKQGKDGMPFWVLKNSWGTGWGENGYMRIAKGTNACGLSAYPNAAVLA